MRSIWHLLKFEVRRLVAPLGAWALLLAGWWAFLWRLGNPDKELNHTLWGASCWSAMAALLVLLLALCVWIGLGHPSRRPDAFWRTRPERPSHVLAAKLLLLAGVLAMWMLVRFLAFVAWGVPWQVSLEVPWQGLLLMLLPTLLIVGLAAWAGSWMRLFAVMGFVGALGFAGFLLFGWLAETPPGANLMLGIKGIFTWALEPDGDGKFQRALDYPRMLDRTRLTLTAAVAIAFWLEYRTRRTSRGVLVFAGGVVVALIVAIFTPPGPTPDEWLAAENPEELFASVEKFEPARSNAFYNTQPAEVVQLRVDLSSWDGRGQVALIQGFYDEIWLSGLGADGRKHRVKVDLVPAGGYVVGDPYSQLERDLAPTHLVDLEKPWSRPGVRGSEIQAEAYLVTTEARKLGIRKGVLSGRLFALQKEILKTGEMALDSPSLIASRFSAKRFGRPVVEDAQLEGTIVRVRGVDVGVGATWRVSRGGMPWQRLWPAFSEARGAPSGVSVIVVHPDGLHAKKVRQINEGSIAAFGWWRSEFALELPLGGVNGSEFPPISEEDISKLRVIPLEVNILNHFKVTIPDTPWELSELPPSESDSR